MLPCGLMRRGLLALAVGRRWRPVAPPPSLRLLRSWPRPTSCVAARTPSSSPRARPTPAGAREHDQADDRARGARARRLDDVVTVSPQAAQSESRRVYLRAGERMTVRDLAIAALVPSANDAATALAAYVGDGLDPAVRRVDEREGRSLGLARHALRQPARARPARSRLERPRHDDSPRRRRSAIPFIRTWSTRSTATIAGGRTLDLDRRPDRHAAADRRQDGAHGRCRLVAGGRRRRGGVRITASVLGSPTRGAANADLGGLLAWGLAQYHRVQGDRRPPRLRARRDRLRARSPSGSSPPRRSSARCASASRSSSASSSARRCALPVARGQRVGEVQRLRGR